MSKNSEKSMTDSAAEMLPKIVAFVNHPDEPGFRVIGVRVSEDEFKYFNEGIDWLKSKLSPASPGVRVPREAIEMLLHKFERAGGAWKVASVGVELGAPSWASNIDNALTELANALAPSSQGNGDGGTPSRLREIVTLCRPAVKAWANQAAMSALNVERGKYPPHYKPLMDAEAKRAAELLDEIDALPAEEK